MFVHAYISMNAQINLIWMVSDGLVVGKDTKGSKKVHPVDLASSPDIIYLLVFDPTVELHWSREMTDPSFSIYARLSESSCELEIPVRKITVCIPTSSVNPSSLPPVDHHQADASEQSRVTCCCSVFFADAQLNIRSFKDLGRKAKSQEHCLGLLMRLPTAETESIKLQIADACSS
jgi:hypothetical protein